LPGEALPPATPSPFEAQVYRGEGGFLSEIQFVSLNLHRANLLIEILLKQNK